MKNNLKKVTFSIGAILLTASVITPIAMSLVNKNKTADSIIPTKNRVSDEEILRIVTNMGNSFDISASPSETQFALEKQTELRKVFGNWMPYYQKREFAGYDVENAFKEASQNGWKSIKDWQKYVQVCSEYTSVLPIRNKFGAVAGQTPETDWIAWHSSPGSKLNQSYKDSASSTVAPNWDNAENSTWNDINNTIPWYFYQSDDQFKFLFDEHNVENAEKRLIFEKKLIPVSIGKISSEVNSNGQARNYFMVDGKIEETLKGDLDYYYVQDNSVNDEFIRDDNGWKVLVSNLDLKQSLITVINPGDHMNSSVYSNNTKSGERNIKYIDYSLGGLINPNENPEYNLKNTLTRHNREFQKRGRYSLVIKANSFTELRNNPYVPLAYQNSFSITKHERFGNSFSESKYENPYLSGQYAWEWVENGSGGYKIWKSLNKIMPAIKSYRSSHGFPYEENPVFYGNFRRLFPVRDWFVNEPNYFDMNGFD